MKYFAPFILVFLCSCDLAQLAKEYELPSWFPEVMSIGVSNQTKAKPKDCTTEPIVTPFVARNNRHFLTRLYKLMLGVSNDTKSLPTQDSDLGYRRNKQYLTSSSPSPTPDNDFPPWDHGIMDQRNNKEPPPMELETTVEPDSEPYEQAITTSLKTNNEFPPWEQGTIPRRNNKEPPPTETTPEPVTETDPDGQDFTLAQPATEKQNNDFPPWEQHLRQETETNDFPPWEQDSRRKLSEANDMETPLESTAEPEPITDGDEQDYTNSPRLATDNPEDEVPPTQGEEEPPEETTPEPVTDPDLEEDNTPQSTDYVEPEPTPPPLPRPTRRVSIHRRSYTGATTKNDRLSNTYFQALEGYSVGASASSTAAHPWAAGVAHSRQGRLYVCTAACVHSQVFITAARCLASLKVNYTTVLYQNYKFPAKAFVLPSLTTKQWFDDIGFIVVYAGAYNKQWRTITVFNVSRSRSDDGFNWFSRLKIPNSVSDFKVVGYTISKPLVELRTETTAYELKELDVYVDINLCSDILAKSRSLVGYHVPCFHSCSVKSYQRKDAHCQKYLGTEGGALIHKITNELFGISTWGFASETHIQLPVGFAVPNSDSFHADYACAVKIQSVAGVVAKGYLHNLCLNIDNTFRSNIT